MVAARTLQSAAALARSPWMCHCVSTASSWRVYGACTAFALSVIVPIALSQRLQGSAPATIALPRRSHYVHRLAVLKKNYGTPPARCGRRARAVRAPCARRARAVTALNTRCARRGHAVSGQSIAN